MGEVLVVGIAGGTGSGKTTLAQGLVSRLAGNVAHLTYDDYYLPHHELSFEERTRVNYDHPDAFDTELLVSHLKALKAGRAIERPVYDFAANDRSDATVLVESAPIVLVEGILIFADEALRACMDLKIFVDVGADIRILRRALRDIDERGRTINDVITRYFDTVKPMHDAFVEPSKYHSDLIVPGGGGNVRALEVVESYLRAHLQAR